LSIKNSLSLGPPQVGFVFDPIEAAWNQRLAELRLFKEANGGTLDVPWKDEEWPGLAAWCTKQVRPYMKRLSI
jgi:hypothetical protein